MIADFKKFRLLMWKNYRLRRFHWILTLVELLLPILVAYGLTKITYSLSTNGSSITIPHRPMKITRQALLQTFQPLHLVYAPSNGFTDSLMKKVLENFGKFNVINLKDENEMENYINAIIDKGITIFDVMTVTFHGCHSDKIPNILNYTIRDQYKWDTHSLYSDLQTPGPEHDDPYRKQGFAAIQMAINDEFTLMKTKQAPWKSKEIYFQAFPYPEYVSDRSAKERIAMLSFIIQSLRAFVSEMVFSIVVLTVTIISIPLIKHIIEEKESGIKELMKIAGLEEWMIWLNWFINGFIVSAISYTIVTIILKYPIHGEGSEGISFVSFPILLIILLMYCLANISYCFMFCAIFHKANIASAIYLITILVLFIGLHYLKDTDIGILQQLLCLLPLGAFSQGFSKIKYFETHGIELTSSTNLSMAENDGHAISLSFALEMLLFDTFLYLFLTFYIMMINPGKFGVRESPFFIYNFLCPTLNDKEMSPTTNSNDEVDRKFIEPPQPNMETTIQIKNLYKNFGAFHVVNGVNLNIYKGEITALLGHNGSGKTTTMSILTGLTSPSAGSIYYKDFDVFENMNLFRESLGMCPQEDRLFPYLTVMDHLLFFGMLKGVSLTEVTQEANEYLTLMELQSKKTSLAKTLSGGMKRKLCLAISLMGKADTLILDEPTSGMDAQSRRKIWDLLLEMRGNRTIILTTHHMEEADALGDRIAIMHQGSIACHGTPIFLKKAYGTGYELTITKDIEETDNLTQIVQSILPNSTKEYQTVNEVIYKLPPTETKHFPTLFRNLETNKLRLGIKSMGMACTTMEHVFLKVGGVSIHDLQKLTSIKVADAACNSRRLYNTTGLSLAFRQIWALFWKKYLYTRENSFGLLTRVVLPTIIIIFLLNGLQSLQQKKERGVDLDLRTYRSSIVMVIKNYVSTSTDMPVYILMHFCDYISECGSSYVTSIKSEIVEALLIHARDNILKYNKNNIMAFELNSTSYRVLYNLKERHSLPIAINTYSNVMLRILTEECCTRIVTRNFPIQEIKAQEPTFLFYIVWFIALGFYTVDLLAYFTGFVNMEKFSGFKHIQMMSNVSPLVYWLGTFTFDFSFFLLVITLRVALFKLFDFFDFLTFSTTLGVVALLIFIYGISGLLFIYTTSFLSSSKNGSYTLLFIMNIISCFIITIFYLFEIILDKSEEGIQFDHWVLLFYATKYLILLTPLLNFSLLFLKLMKIWRNNSQCNYATSSSQKICKETFPEVPYLTHSSKNSDNLLLGIEFLLFDIVLYAVILALIDGGYFDRWFNKWKIFVYDDHLTNENVGDSDVQGEYEAVQSVKSTRNALVSKQAALLVDGLRKNYFIWNQPFRPPKIFKTFTAVADVNFLVKPGECFGLIGVNGAGKTTTFKILTTDILPTKGDAAIEGVRLSTNKKSYMSMAGYCTQTNCFVEELTGRETLTLIALLRGMKQNNLGVVVDKWISILGLQDYQNQNCGTYSGGNKRKLCTALSLIGNPRVVFLDEPTSGVDPVSRRALYDVIGQSKDAGQALVLTSHSMEECETLCDRLTIMAAGVMKCIGTTQHLKKQYAQGFSLLIKIYNGTEIIEKVEHLKSDIINVFSSKDINLKDEHTGLLYYQIKDTSLLWSNLFAKMEEIKHRYYEVIDDYVLTDTTLEEVFLSFTKPDNKN